MIMAILKKQLIQFPFYKMQTFNFIYDSDDELQQNVISVIALLKIPEWIVQLFVRDEKSELFAGYPVTRRKNFNYYTVDAAGLIGALGKICFTSLRFMSIYSCTENTEGHDLLYRTRHAEAAIFFDNYLEVAETTIDMSKYKDNILHCIKR